MKWTDILQLWIYTLHLSQRYRKSSLPYQFMKIEDKKTWGQTGAVKS